jgi:serine/threonine protein kinase
LIKVRPDPMQGRIVLGRYRLATRIARGGMAAVYLARNVEDGTRAAVKVLRDDLALEIPVRERFLIESRAAGLIDHPAVVKVFDVGETSDGRVCLAMEYVEGGSLRRLVGKAPLSAERTIVLASAVAQGVAAAHAQGVVHRDLKPENVLLPRRAEDGALVKIVDFGIARILDAPRITTTRHVMGTPQYISPEQATGAAVDARADIYALGVMMYEMLAGCLPFSSADHEDLMRQHISQVPQPPGERCPAARIPPALEELVMRCLAKPPRARPGGMGQVLAVLSGL